MKTFVSKLVEKFNNKVLMIFAIVLGSLALLAGIFSIAFEPREYTGVFLNFLVLTALFALLVYLLYKDDKKKVFIVSLIILADFVLSSFGNGIQAFVNGADGRGAFTAGMVFIGLGALGIFAAVVIHVIMLLKDSVNKDLLHFVCTLIFAISGFFYFLGGILMVCEIRDGMSIASSLFTNFFIAGEAAFFGFGGKQLLSAE